MKQTKDELGTHFSRTAASASVVANSDENNTVEVVPTSIVDPVGADDEEETIVTLQKLKINNHKRGEFYMKLL